MDLQPAARPPGGAAELKRQSRRRRDRDRRSRARRTPARSLDQQILARRASRRYRLDQGHARQVGEQYQARVDRALPASRLDPWPALRQGGHHRGLVHDGDRPVLVIHHHQGAGLGGVGPADRLRAAAGSPGWGWRGGPAPAPAAPAAVRAPGSRAAPGSAAGPHEGRDDRQPGTRRRGWRPLPARAASTNGTTSTATASARHAQAATTVACPARPVTFHTPARSVRPPSRRQPWEQVEHPHQLGSRKPAGRAGRRGRRRRGRPGSARVPAHRQRQRDRGASHRDEELLAGRGRLTLDLREPPSG